MVGEGFYNVGVGVAGQRKLTSHETFSEIIGSVVRSFVSYGENVEKGVSVFVEYLHGVDHGGIFGDPLGHEPYLGTADTDVICIIGLDSSDHAVESLPSDGLHRIDRTDGNLDKQAPQGLAPVSRGRSANDQYRYDR